MSPSVILSAAKDLMMLPTEYGLDGDEMLPFDFAQGRRCAQHDKRCVP